jgi:tripartite-type tricarboxylate transporter receptor subunit TctC
MRRLTCKLLATIAVWAISAGSVLHAQNYPSKPIRIITAEPGGISDFGARVIAQGMSASMGQQVIVDNRGGGALASPPVAKAPPDGYTLTFQGSNMWLLPLFQENAPYDPIKDFAPISVGGRAPNVLVVHPSLPVKSVKELIALAKAHPGALNYASGTTGSGIHVASEMFKAMAGVNIVRVNYKGTSQAITDLVAGQVQVMFPNAGSGMPLIKAGRLRALAITSAKPSALMPGLPTIADSGVPGYESGAFTAMFAPANTPAPIISRLNQEMLRVLNQPDVKQKYLDRGVEVEPGTPAELLTAVKAEMSAVAKVIKDSGVKGD